MQILILVIKYLSCSGTNAILDNTGKQSPSLVSSKVIDCAYVKPILLPNTRNYFVGRYEENGITRST